MYLRALDRWPLKQDMHDVTKKFQCKVPRYLDYRISSSIVYDKDKTNR